MLPTQAKAQEALSAPPARGLLQRKCACGQHTMAGGKCEECGKKRLQRRAASQAESAEVPSIVHDVLRSPGQPLDTATRAFMEPRFGHDFSHVRLHLDGRAAESAHAVDALAYTVGHDIIFGAGQYAPQTFSGQRLLAHELTHTLQQSSNRAVFQGKLSVGLADDAYEREADQFAERVTGAGTARVGSLSSARAGVQLQRECVAGKWKYEYDGCSGPPGVLGKLVDVAMDRQNPAGGKDTEFAKGLPSDKGGRACDRHDECYQTCHQGGESSQSACDVQMLEDMLDTCSDSDPESEESARCYRWAKTYYQFMLKVGRIAYRQRQKKVCGCEAKAKASQPKDSQKESSGKTE
jgi:Domain of unknown function (DUF4157)